MREIIFRGKLTNGYGWAEGNLNIRKNEIAIITPDETPIGRYGRVIPETVGQYTGLKDKNGTKIFEGDILEEVLDIRMAKYVKRAVVVADEWNCSCCNGVYGFSTDPINGYTTLDLRDYGGGVVIGNIHDNPELLKESETE